MIQLRPKTSTRYLTRARLLKELPDAPGYAVVLEAPYGYGKSVLASQWAEHLKEDGWRVLWLTPAGRDVRGLLGGALGLRDAPWGVLLGALSATPTLLVLEDLEGGEDLTPLLKPVRGLLLLASRRALPHPELLRLTTAGRLVRLDARTLAFTQEEATALFSGSFEDGLVESGGIENSAGENGAGENEAGENEAALAAWRRTRGWPLPLHFAALTGEAPAREALVEGVRGSLSPEGWDEALFLSALPYLPIENATEHTRALLAAGFVQALEAGYRLHPLVADTLRTAYAESVEHVVLKGAARLSPLLRGTAFERAGLHHALAELLATGNGTLSRHDPVAVLRWDALAPPAVHAAARAAREVEVGWALWATGRKEEGVARLLEAANAPALGADARLALYKELVWFLAQQRDVGRAQEVARLGRSLLGETEPEGAGRFLSNVFMIHFTSGDWAEAEATLREALAVYPADSPFRPIATGNLAIVRWHRHGDLYGLLAERSKALASNRRVNPANVPGDLLQLAELKSFLGRIDEALSDLSELHTWRETNPRWALEGEALRASLEGDAGTFPSLFAEAERWEDDELVDRVVFFWAGALRASPQEALARLGGHDGPWATVARAAAQGRSGAAAEALRTLGEAPSPQSFMERRVYWHATRFDITGAEEDLAALLNLTDARERLLPGLVSLRDLPRTRPELARAYPLEAVLASSWREAVTHRAGEIPPLELTLLGRFSARVLGREVDLTTRHKEILTLLLLRCDRDAVGETLWPEASKSKVRNNLHVQLASLRKVLEPWGVPVYLLEDGLARTHADLWALEAALTKTQADTVLALYQEPFAPGVHIAPVETARENLREQVVKLLYESAAGNEEGAAPRLERVLELEPLHERALQALLQLLLARGRRREAGRRYQEFARRLEEETALEPLPETRRLLTQTF